MTTTKQSPLSELQDRWYQHGLNLLELTREEFETAGGSFRMLDLRDLNTLRMYARDVVREKTQRELKNAAAYDPLRATQLVLIVRFDREYHVMNGNNRVFLFGSSVTNPHNRALPVFVFNSPAAFEALTSGDAWTCYGNARLFNFNH